MGFTRGGLDRDEKGGGGMTCERCEGGGGGRGRGDQIDHREFMSSRRIVNWGRENRDLSAEHLSVMRSSRCRLVCKQKVNPLWLLL